MGNQCCAPAGNVNEVNGPPIEQQIEDGELKIKRNRKILEANMGQKIAEIAEQEEKYVALRDRRKKPQSPQEGNYLMNFQEDDEMYDPLESSKNKRLKKALHGSAMKDGSLSKTFLASLKQKNLSVASASKSILSAAQALSNSQNMSSRMSSRLSIQSKRKLIALQSASKREQYTSLYKDVAINKHKIQRDSQWLKEKMSKIFDGNKNLIKLNQSNFYIYGGGLLQLQSKCLVHQYLYANLMELIDINDIEELKTKQTIVERVAKHTKTFGPDQLQQIIDFVNKNSNTFKQHKDTSSKKLQIEQMGQDAPVKEQGFQVKCIQHLYDTLNAHVFQVVESVGRCDQFSEKTQYIIKVPRAQTKKGIFDLVFETQLQQYLAKQKFTYQFTIKEELFEVYDSGQDQSKLLNYVAIEERQNCGIFNAQLTLREFINQMKGSDIEMKQKSEKLLYLFLQAIDLTKQLTKGHKIINYNINPLNLIITEHFKLKLVDFSLVDFCTISHDDQSSITSKSSEQTIKDSLSQLEYQLPIIMRSQFKNQINELKETLLNLQLNNTTQLSNEELEQLGIQPHVQLMNQQIKTADDYFDIIQKIKSSDNFSLNLIMNCFQDLFPKPEKGPGGIMKIKHSLIEDTDITRFIEQIIHQSDTSKQLEIILNNVESHICYDMNPQDFQNFLSLFNDAEKSSFGQQARLKMAKQIYQVAILQNSERLQALCLLAIGEITKNIKTLQDCLQVYEKSNQDSVLNKHQYSQLCLCLAKEYRLIGGAKNQQKGMFYLEQAYQINQGKETDSNLDKISAKSHNEIMLTYYQEMSEQYLANKKESQAIECQKKALQIAKIVFGSENFTTMECYLNLANNLEKHGQKEEAEILYNQCLENFDKKDAQMKKYDEENDFNGSLNSAENISQKLKIQQQRLFGGINMSIKERDASVIQRIGIYYRQKQDYDRACDVLERVLEVRKKQFLSRKQKQDDGKYEGLSDFQMPIDEEDIEQFQGREFATLYNDLALTYQCMEDLAYAQEYLILAIQCLEKLQTEDINTEFFTDQELLKYEIDKEQGLQELAESYLFLADILRKQNNIEQSSQAMLKAIEIEQDLPDRQLCLVESYKQLAEDYLLLQDFDQGIQSAKLALDIELQIYDGEAENDNIQETLIFIAEAHQFSGQFIESNEQLSIILEVFSSGNVDLATQIKVLKLVSTNLQSLENYEEAINYQMKTLKLCHDLEDKINIYQQIANNFLQIGDHAQAIENQMMVYNLVRVIANGGSEDNLEDCDETEQTIQALYNLVQIKFLVVQQQIQEANEYGDTSVINTDFLMDTKGNLDLLIIRMTALFGDQLLRRPEYEQSEQMLNEINELIS